MKFKVLLGSALALAVVSSFAGAQAAAQPDRKARVEKLDANGDGLISRDEASKAPRLTKQFDAIDSNKDGQLSRDELAAFRKVHGKGGASRDTAQPGA